MVDTCGARAVLADESKDDYPLDSQTAEVNHIEAGEDPGKYAGFESDAANDDGDDEDVLLKLLNLG
ncbi:hypothetical protein PHMEG_00036292 [Phytophthora megakarya]|uniref:Uncharacterized protein n=1 Tax=Phytophthora megakarya TaxID=4795 RepID=A0A225ULW0_9STRA|nr:hypothetical protein PHMEG_00036292 [Phytophthora megakarya]